MVFLNSMENAISPVVMKVIHNWNMVFVSSMGNCVLPVVMRVDKLLEHCLCSLKSCFASRYES